LQTLKASGEKLAGLAADLRERAARGAADGSTLDSAMADSLVDVGIVNPVTKSNTGTKYQERLSAQLEEFLRPVLRKERGMMALHDVYCVFNRRALPTFLSFAHIACAPHLRYCATCPDNKRCF
jgi:EAP30/Vps36 family